MSFFTESWQIYLLNNIAQKSVYPTFTAKVVKWWFHSKSAGYETRGNLDQNLLMLIEILLFSIIYLLTDFSSWVPAEFSSSGEKFRFLLNRVHVFLLNHDSWRNLEAHGG